MPEYRPNIDPLSDFSREVFTAPAAATPGDASKAVYWIGEGPGIVMIPEMPGLTPEVADAARRFSAEGFTVAVPSLFGTPGKPMTNGYAASSLPRGCVSREFVAFGTGSTSPVTGWLRALAAHVHERCGGPGIGVVGMCFSGGFALGLMVDEFVLAPVLSQPSLPFAIGKKQRRDLGLSPDDLAAAKQRVADGVCVIGMRFTEDRLVPGERFDRLREEFGEGFVGVEIDSSAGNEWGFDKMAHSVLTHEFSDEPGHPTNDAYRLVIDHFREHLLAPA